MSCIYENTVKSFDLATCKFNFPSLDLTCAGFSVEFCTAVALVVTGITLIYTRFGRVTWAHRAQAARGVRGHAPPGNFLFKMLRNAFPFILGAYFLIFSKQV